jgi:hypothetical protein
LPPREGEPRSSSRRRKPPWAAPIVLSGLASIKTAPDASAIPPNYLPRALISRTTPRSSSLSQSRRDRCRRGSPSSSAERRLDGHVIKVGCVSLAPSSPPQANDLEAIAMFKTIFASIGVTLVLALAPLQASAQSNPPPGAASAAAIPRTAAGAGSNASRTRHRNTLNRQRARATSEHARRVRANSRR